MPFDARRAKGESVPSMCTGHSILCPYETPARGQPRGTSLEIESALFLKSLQIFEDILLNLSRLRFRIQFLQVRDDLLDRVVTVAAFDNFQARTI